MVFSSFPVYLDPPNWPQQPNQQQEGAAGENFQLPPLMPPPPPVGGGGPASIRPGSMTERARLAKLPQPDTVLQCPRCESTNTKFCYYNNYSLTQPRHFCKTCRRYWTRGGALRNVPVGGGCRRNKRSKGSRSKSPITSDLQSSSTSTTSGVSSNSCSTDIMSHLPPSSQLSFFHPLHNHPDFTNADIGLNFGGMQPLAATRGGGNEIEFQICNARAAMGAGPLNLSARFADQWGLQQVQQFPFLAGLEQSTGGVYQFEGEATDQPLGYGGGTTDQLGSKSLEAVGASVKLEENQQGPKLSRNFLSAPGNDQYWSGNAWTDLSGSTSSASHLI